MAFCQLFDSTIAIQKNVSATNRWTSSLTFPPYPSPQQTMAEKPSRKLTRRNKHSRRRSNGSGVDRRLSYERLEPRQLLAAMPIISEFVASNDSSLQDGFGASPDWIEIHNAGDTAVDLIGYHLTDNFADPTRWTFDSSTILDPGAYLVVFASGNTIPDPEGNLHTNFSLSASGEYLGFYAPDGTVLSEFGSATTNYPALQGDEAFGVAFDSTTTAVVTPTSSAQYFIPTDASVDATWTGNNFNDSAWNSGTASLGYEENPADYQDLILTTVPEGTTTLYVRVDFQNSDPSALLDTLQLRYDDGFIAYLNGVEIASANAPADPAFISTATGQHADDLAVDFVDFNISQFTDALQVGTNTLAIHLLNRNSGSSDLLIAPNLTLTTGSLITPVVEGRLLAPTPGQPNTTVTAGDVSFSRVGGVFEQPFSLALASTGANETIRFTTDGSEPTASSEVYSSALPITSSTQIRARSFGSIGQVGPVSVATYSRADSTTANFTSDLPVIVIENLGAGDPGDGDFVEASLALYDVDDVTGRTSFSNTADLTSLIGQHRRGSSTLNNPKPNLRIETRDVNGDDLDVEILGLGAESDYVLTGPYRFDRSFIRDSLLHDLSNQTGNYAVKTRFVEVYANYDGGTLTNGDYIGVYVLLENIKIGDNRVDIAGLDPDDNSEPDITGGYIIKIDRGGGFETTRGVPNRGGASFVFVDPEPTDLSPEQNAYVRGYVQDLEDALYGPNATDPELGYEAYLDVEASIDHHIFRTLSLEPDSLGLSTFLTKDRDGKLAFGPLWDFDRSQGSDGDLRSSDPEVWFSGVDFFEFDWWGELFNDPDFKQQWIDRWQELRLTTFSDSNILATINAQASQLVEASARNFARWPENPPNGGEYADAGLTGWEAEVSHLAGWLMARVDWIDSRVVAAPTLGTNPGNVSAGSQLTLSGQSGADIYYTLDGTDPRADGGGLSSSAILYTGPLTVSATTQIVSRANDTPTESVGQTPGTSPWSQAVQGLYSVEVPASSGNLRFSELHYHPADPSAAELLEVPGADEDDYEFVELMNVSDDPISLNGVTLGVAVNFDFTTAAITSLAPGETVLVVNNIAAFEARYGTGFPIAGEYSGKFSDSTERVMLIDSLDQVIHDFTYTDTTPWPIGADGDGPSFEMIDPTTNHSDPANWRVSAMAGGTPGVAPVDIAPQVVNSVRDGGSIARPDLLGTFVVTFDQDVSIGAANLIVQNDTLGGSVVDTSGVGFIYDAAARSATWDFSALVLDAAFYSFELSSSITGVSGGLALDGNGDGMGGDAHFEVVYVAIPGDRNLDGVVDVVNDVLPTNGNLGTTQGASWAAGDFSGDGAVEVVADVLRMTGNLNKSVVPSAASPLQLAEVPIVVVESPEDTDAIQTANVELDVDVAVEEDDLVPLNQTANTPVPLAEATAVPTEIVSFQRDDQRFEDVELLERPDEIQTLSVEFSADVAVEADDLVLVNQTTNLPVSLEGATFSSSNPTIFRATWDLSTLAVPLTAGYYRASIFADSDTSNNNGQNGLPHYTDEFYLALAGDVNLDGTVDVVGDVLTVNGNLGASENVSWQDGDFNHDGLVDALDVDIVNDTLGSSVAIDEVFAQLDV